LPTRWSVLAQCILLNLPGQTGGIGDARDG
jgi:hypothetical protein